MTDDRALKDVVARALAEDVGAGDITSKALIAGEAGARAKLNQKEPGLLYGFDAAAEAFSQAGAMSFEPMAAEEEWREEVPSTVAIVTGPARSLLAGERVALNFLGHLSGIASLTARYVKVIRGTKARILDTRKTTPGLRILEKAAVVAGGGENHRMGLDDAVLIKENHIAVAGGVRTAVERARRGRPHDLIEVECKTLGDVSEAIAGGAQRILLDNMDPPSMDSAVILARGSVKGKIEVEASGGVNLQNVRRIAETGVDYISIGALTHSAPALDLSLMVERL